VNLQDARCNSKDNYIARLPAYGMTGFFLTMLPHIKHKKGRIIGFKTTFIVHVKKTDFNTNDYNSITGPSLSLHHSIWWLRTLQ